MHPSSSMIRFLNLTLSITLLLFFSVTLTTQDKIKYHNGPVMSSHITIHIIWYGNWLPVQKSIIREFINSISTPKLVALPFVSDWWKTVHLYTDQTNASVSATVSLGKEINDVLLSHGRNLTFLSIQSVINAAIKDKSNPLPVDNKGGLYLVLTADDILMEDFCIICGFHYFTYASIVGYTLPFAWVGNSGKMCPGACAFPFAVPDYVHGVQPYKPPNGDLGVDAMVSVIAYEIAGLATNPLRNAWYAGNDPKFPREIGDFCFGVYGIGGGYADRIGAVQRDEKGAVYNMFGIERRFLVQWVWNHLIERCSGP